MPGPDRRARRATSTAGAGSCSRCRRASSTSAARRRPRTSAPRRRSTRSPASSTSPGSGARGHRRARRAAARRVPPTPASGSRRCDGVRAAARAAGRARVRAATGRRDVAAVGRAARARGVNPGVRLGRELPRAGSRRPARRDHRAAHARRHRPARRRARRGGGGRAAGARAGRRHEPSRRRARRSSRRARRAAARSRAPELDVPEVDARELLPARFRAPQPPRLPEVSEPEIVRHYVRLSKRNFDLDSGFYPLGSCTMKHNPRLHERVAALPGHARLHPLQDAERAQGALRADVAACSRRSPRSPACRTSRCSPRPARTASSPGVLLTRAYHERSRRARGARCSTPDTAHGTNPATVTMAGLRGGQGRRPTPRGGIDLDDLRAKADARRRLPDAHQPEHARPFRREHRADRARSCTALARRSTTTAPT